MFFVYPFGEKDGAEAALAQLFDNLILVEVIVVVLVVEDVLALEAQAGSSEGGGGRVGLEKSAPHGAAVALLDRGEPVSGRTGVEAAGSAAHFLVPRLHALEHHLLLRVEIAVVLGRRFGGVSGRRGQVERFDLSKPEVGFSERVLGESELS